MLSLTSFAGDVGFQQWRRSTLAKLERSDAQTPTVSVEVQSPRTLPPASVVPRHPVDPEAGAWWNAAVEVLRPELAVLDICGVEDAVPVRSEAGTVAVSVSTDLAARALHRLAPKLERVLSDQAGSPVALRMLYTPAADAGTEGVQPEPLAQQP